VVCDLKSSCFCNLFVFDAETLTTTQEAPIQTAIDVMSRYNKSRLAVSDLKGNLFSIVSQSRIVSFLARAAFEGNLGKIENKTIDNYRLGYEHVILAPLYFNILSCRCPSF
jgi:hypothetical protein